MLTFYIQRLRGLEQLKVYTVGVKPTVTQRYTFQRQEQFGTETMFGIANKFLAEHFKNAVIKSLKWEDAYTVQVDCIITHTNTQ